MRAPMAAKPLVYRTPGMDAVTVRKGIAYRDGLTLDLYCPPGHGPNSAPIPAVVIILGYPGAGAGATAPPLL